MIKTFNSENVINFEETFEKKFLANSIQFSEI